MNASQTGIGAILSQWFEKKNKLFPVAFYCHKLMPVEHNYGISKQEFLAEKLALEEWKH